jgi:hypothetical protein
MLSFYITSTIICLATDLFMLSLFEHDNPRFIRIMWSIGLFLPIWNIVQSILFFILLVVQYICHGNFGEYEPRDTKWAKWFLNEE